MSENEESVELYAQKKQEDIEVEMEAMVKNIESYKTEVFIDILKEWQIWRKRGKIEAKMRKVREKVAQKINKILDKKYKATRRHKAMNWLRNKKNKAGIKLSNAKISINHALKSLRKK